MWILNSTPISKPPPKPAMPMAEGADHPEHNNMDGVYYFY